MSIINPPPPPRRGPLVDPRTGLITKEWDQYLRNRDVSISQTTPLLTTVPLDGQTASLGVTPFRAFATGTLAGGLYRVSWVAKVTTAAAVSSSLTVHLTFTRGSQTCTLNGSPLTTNTTTSVTTATALIRIDAGTPVSYSTTYASSGAPAMVYELDLTLEQVALS